MSDRSGDRASARIVARVVALSALVFAGCHVAGEYERPHVATPAGWTQAEADTLPDPPDERWWRSFGDAQLDRLIERALASNLDVRIARSRVLEARALRDIVAGGSRPTVDIVAGYARTRQSENTAQGQFAPRTDDFYQIGFDARWELDVFGRNAYGVEAAEAGIDVAEDQRRGVIVALLAEVARAYIELRGLQRGLAVTRGNLALQEDTLALTRARFSAGLVGDLDVARIEALAATTAAQIPTLEGDLRRNVHRLSVLLASEPAALAAELEAEVEVPPAPDTLSAGLPADLLRRRPDVRGAERELAAAAALSNQATADLFPRLTLGATFGQASREGADLFDAASNVASIGGSIVQPLFAGGVLRANIRVQEEREAQALLRYQQVVLDALAEVEDALTACHREEERWASISQALESNRRAVSRSSALYERGLIDFLDVLDAQRAQLASESELARSATQRAANVVALYKALGGGWEIEE